MLQSQDGQMMIPSADVKEQVHQLPQRLHSSKRSEQKDHAIDLLANGWHVGVARLMLYLVVTFSASVPYFFDTPGSTNYPLSNGWYNNWPSFPPYAWVLEVGPIQPNSIPPADDMWQHWEYSAYILFIRL